MKRASYRAAIEWIAANDEAGTDGPGNPDAEANVACYVTTLLVADLFDADPQRIARDVMRARRKDAIYG